MIKIIGQTFIPDGEGGRSLVRATDFVELLNPSQKRYGEDEIMSQEQYDFMKKYLKAEGSYEIGWIGQWPCGKTILYLNVPGRGQPGAQASNFKCVKR